MLVFTSQDRARVEPCTIYSGYEKTEELNGALQIQFETGLAADNSAAFSILDFETFVQDEDGHVYIVKQIQSTHKYKEVTALHEYFELDDIFNHGTFGGTRTAQEFFSFAFSQTGWTFQLDAAARSRTLTLPNFGSGNSLELIEQLCAAFNLERQILPGRIVKLSPRIGADNEVIFKYADNIKTLEYEVDTTKLKTRIVGRSDKLTGQVEYVSPAAAVFGYRDAEPIEDNSIETDADMIALLKSKLDDVPETAISVDVLQVDAEVGDVVFLIHEPLNLEYETRVLAKTTQRNYAASSVTIGNALPRTLADAIADQQEQIKTNQRTTRSRFEQTDDRITLEVEEVGKSIASLEIRSDKIETSVTDLESNTNSKITQTASEIRGELQSAKTTIEQSIGNLNGIVTTNTQNISSVSATAERIQSTVSSQTTQISNLGTRMWSAESSITQHANEINLRVRSTDFTGNNIISQINLSSTAATISARRINLVGAVTVLSDITGNLGTITAGTINSVTLNSVNIQSGTINIDTDATVGNTLYLGRLWGGGTKSIYFNNTANISSSYDSISISAEYLRFYGVVSATFDGSVSVAGSLSVGGYQVATTRTYGLGFGYSSGSKRLYVSLYGSDVGYVTLT